MDCVVEGDYKEAISFFSDSLQLKIDVKTLEKSIESRTKTYGEIVQRERLVKTFCFSKNIVYRHVWFGVQGFRFYFEIGDNGKFSDFVVIKESLTQGWKIPKYANPANCETKHVLIQSGNYGLPAELLIPKGVENYPVVVLIHGSGPSDRDEAMQTLRPFKDIAYGLANQGIASLRYDKSTYLFAKYFLQNKEFTVWDETGSDVVNIVKYLETRQSISENRIVLLGHSMGAMMLPRICDSVDVGALVMVSGNARPLQDLIYEQLEFFAKKDGYTRNEKERMEILSEQVENVDKLRSISADSVKFALPFGLPAYYWKDLAEYNQVKCLEKISEPVFLLQGEGDYQVSMKDYKMFKKVLKNRKLPYLAKSYPKVNHMLFENLGKPSVSEYNRNEHVENYIIKDIADWINLTVK